MCNPQQRKENEYPCMKEGSIKIVLILKTVYNLWPKHWQRVKENDILLFQTSLRWTPACTGLDCWAVCQCWISKGNDGLKVQHVMQRKAHSDQHWKPFGSWKKFLSFFGNIALWRNFNKFEVRKFWHILYNLVFPKCFYWIQWQKTFVIERVWTCGL